MVWTNYKEEDNPFSGSQTAVLDLTSDDPDKNYLLALATAFGGSQEPARPNAGFGPALRKVFESAGGALYAADAFLDLAGLYNPQLHALYWFINRRSNFVRNEQIFTKDPRMLSLPLNFECLIELDQYTAVPLYQRIWRAFVKWRSGRAAAALNDLNGVLSSAPVSSDAGPHALLRASEIGLGIIAEQLWFARENVGAVKTTEIQTEFLNRVHELQLQPWWGDLETIDRRIKREKRLVEIEYRTAGNKLWAIDKLRELFQLSRDLQLYGEMIGLMHSAWLVDMGLGDELSHASHSDQIPANDLIAVRKKNFFHRQYNNGWVGRGGLFFGERIVPPAAEIPFAIMHHVKGIRARAEFETWQQQHG